MFASYAQTLRREKVVWNSRRKLHSVVRYPFSVSHWLLTWRKQQATTNETKFINLDHLGMDHYLISKNTTRTVESSRSHGFSCTPLSVCQCVCLSVCLSVGVRVGNDYATERPLLTGRFQSVCFSGAQFCSSLLVDDFIIKLFVFSL